MINDMQVAVLASGSSGNATVISYGDTKLLVDAGISARRIKKALANLAIAPEDLTGVLITHEHRDHISGLTTLTKHYKIPIYTRADTFRAMYCKAMIDESCVRCIGEKFGVGNLKIEAFNISHDAADPVGFSIYGKNIKCTIATDLGFVTSTVQQAIDNSDILVLEANHDIDMVRNGTYPRSLKQRILSNRGHLSNNDAAWALVRMKKQRHTRVLLAHLSEENNSPTNVQNTIYSIMQGQGYDLATDLDIRLTKPNEAVSF